MLKSKTFYIHYISIHIVIQSNLPLRPPLVSGHFFKPPFGDHFTNNRLYLLRAESGNYQNSGLYAKCQNLRLFYIHYISIHIVIQSNLPSRPPLVCDHFFKIPKKFLSQITINETSRKRLPLVRDRL